MLRERNIILWRYQWSSPVTGLLHKLPDPLQSHHWSLASQELAEAKELQLDQLDCTGTSPLSGYFKAQVVAWRVCMQGADDCIFGQFSLFIFHFPESGLTPWQVSTELMISEPCNITADRQGEGLGEIGKTDRFRRRQKHDFFELTCSRCSMGSSCVYIYIYVICVSFLANSMNQWTRAHDHLQRCDAVPEGASSLQRIGWIPRKAHGDRSAPAVGRALRRCYKGRHRPARRRTALRQLPQTKRRRRWCHGGRWKPFHPWRRAHSQLQCLSRWMLGLKLEPNSLTHQT